MTLPSDAPTGDGVIQIAYLHGENVSHSFHDSMRRVMDYDRAHGAVIAPRPLNMRCGSGILLVPTRNYAARLFLDRTEHEWMLFCDTDMGFEDDAVHRLLASADPFERPVVGGLCFAVMTGDYDGAGGWRQTIVPTMYKIGEMTDGSGHTRFCYYGPYERNAVCRVAATGAAFLLIHRSVLVLMREKFGDEWFSQVRDDDGDTVGEDITFCLRALSLQVPIHVNTGVRTTHHKASWVSEEDYLKVTGQYVETYPDLPVFVHLEATFAALRENLHERDGMLKFKEDLDRYREILAATKPEVIVETGTHTGASAVWLAEESGAEVITIDVAQPDHPARFDPRVTYFAGSSVDPAVVASTAERVGDRRCMVILDSDHSGPHVAAEIAAYGPMVTPGCYLVVEDTVFGYGESPRSQHFPNGLDGSPLDAVVALLVGNPQWSRDVAIEQLSPVSSNPAGWWLRVAGDE